MTGSLWTRGAVAAFVCLASVAIAQKPDSTRAAPRKEGGAGGTTPQVFGRNLAVYNDFNRLDIGIDINQTYLDIMFPVIEDENHVHRGLFWIEVPFVEAQRNLDRLPLPPGSPTAPSAVAGLGDIFYRVFAIPWYNEKRTFQTLAGVDFYIPSAQGELFFSQATNAFAELSLGSGKYQIAPAVGFVWAPRPNVVIVPLYWYEASFAGDPERHNVRLGKLRMWGRYAFPSRFYVLPQLQVYTNYANFPAEVDSLFNNTEVFFRPEVGLVLSKDGTTIHVKPGFALKDPGLINRKWGLEGGILLKF